MSIHIRYETYIECFITSIQHKEMMASLHNFSSFNNSDNLIFRVLRKLKCKH